MHWGLLKGEGALKEDSFAMPSKFLSSRYKVDTALTNFYSLVNIVMEKYGYKAVISLQFNLFKPTLIVHTIALIKFNTVFSLEWG